MDNAPDKQRPVDASMLPLVNEIERKSLAFSKKLMDNFLPRLSQQFADLSDKAKNNDQAWRLLQLSRQISEQQTPLTEQFQMGLKAAAQAFRNGKSNNRTTEPDDLLSDLSLLANDELEQDLASTSLARKVETRFSDTLYTLNQRLAVINNGKKLNDSDNPIGAYQFATSLQELLLTLKLEKNLSTFSYRLFEQIVLEEMQDFYRNVNEYLISKGVLPNLKYGRAQPDATKRQAAAPDRPTPPPTRAAPGSKDTASPAEMLETIRVLQETQAQLERKLHAQQSAVVTPFQPAATDRIQTSGYQPGFFSQPGFTFDGNAAVAVCQPQEVISAISAVPTAQLAEQLSQQVIQPLTVEQFQQVTLHLRQQLGENKRIDDDQGKVIDTVGMIFEYMLSDRQLPDPVKAVLSYLHTPYLKVALAEGELLNNPEHPSRKLLDSLADAGSKWVGTDGNSQFKTFPKIKSIVRRVVTEYSEDLSLFAELLLEMQEFNQKVENNIMLVERRSREKAEGEERLREVKGHVLREVKQRMEGYSLPSPVIVLLLHPWSDYLTFTLLRHGEDATQWQEGLSTIEDIIWSIQPKEDMEQRKRLIVLQETIQNRVQEGLETIAYDQGKSNKLLDALHKAQMISLENMIAEPATAEKRAEMEAAASQEAGIQEEKHEALLSSAEQELVDKLRTVEFGTWLEFDELDELQNQRVKIAWFNARTSRYMLIDRSGKQIAMKSGAEIARLMLTSKARVVAGSAKPFFERALENIFARLKAAMAR